MLTAHAKRILHRLFCTGCGAFILYVTILWLVDMTPREFWRWQ